MTSPNPDPASVAAQIRRALQDGGSADHAAGVQWFFKDEIKSRGWYTADLRRAVRRCRREILRKYDFSFLVRVADHLFSGAVLEEKVAAVFLLEKLDNQFGEREFKLFESWLDRVSSWADHDGLVHYLIAPMVAAQPARTKAVFRWAKSPDRWHRRAACVALIQGTRCRMFFPPDHPAFQRPSRRSRRYGAERPGLAAPRNRQVRCPAHRALPDENSPPRAAAGAPYRLRDAAESYEEEGSGSPAFVIIPLWEGAKETGLRVPVPGRGVLRWPQGPWCKWQHSALPKPQIRVRIPSGPSSLCA